MPKKEEKPKPRWALRIAELRSKLGMNQRTFATALSVDQANVSRWEQGKNRPLPDTFAHMAKLAPDMEKFYFLEEAGLPKEFFMGGIEGVMPSEMVGAATSVVANAFSAGSPKLKGIPMAETQVVLILSDAVAAGNPMTINERDIDLAFPLPTQWLPRGSRVFGIRVVGDSMEPTLRNNDIALVDVNSRDLKKLDGSMVAVRVGDGVTIKWLRKSGIFYQLVPQNTSPRHEIKIMSESDDWSIVGEVVKWIGAPHKPPKKR